MCIIRNLIILLLLSNSILLHGQTFNIIHAFTGGADGQTPYTGVLLSSNTLYGGTYSGGSTYGTLYSINADGSGFKVLHSITNAADGSGPNGLILADGVLYGTSQQAGPTFQGKIFSITGNTNFNTLHVFDGVNGYYPLGQLVLVNNRLYGTAEFGGANNQGIIFSISTNGSAFTNLYSFIGNTDGSSPAAGLILSGNTLFGTCMNGGSASKGSIFAFDVDGAGITNLHSFLGGNDGFAPQSRLALVNGRLYGTTRAGGTNGWGNIFCIYTNGTGYSVLHSLATTEGISPLAGLVLYGDTLFGTGYQGGTNNCGTLFMVRTNGANFTVLHHFTRSTEGAYPQCELAFDGNTLYGTLANSGSNGYGAIYGYTITPRISGVQVAQTDLIISAINGLSGHAYALWMSTNVALPTSQWKSITTNVPAVSGNFTVTVTNGMNAAASQQFFRLEAQ